MDPRRPAALALCAAGLLLAAARAQPWTFERRLAPGTRARVDELHESVLRLQWKGRDGAVGDEEVNTVERRFVEEVRATTPLVLHRQFELSQRAKRRPKAEAEPLKTSLHGRGVLVAGHELKPDDPIEVSKEDRELLRLDLLAHALLPERPAGRREPWQADPGKLVAALFGPGVRPAPGTGARVEVERVERKGDDEVAVLRARVALRLERTETIPGVTADLAGELRWSLRRGLLVAAALEGPITYAAGARREEGGEVTVQGVLRWTWRATPLDPAAAEPAPPR